MPEDPLLSVCVLILSDAQLVRGCLDSLAAVHQPERLETLVVANGTAPDRLGELEQREDIVLIRSPSNLGFAGGNNLASQVARGRYLLLLNDDSRVASDFIDRLVASAERDAAIGAVGGRILSDDGTLQEAGSVLWNDGWVNHVGLGEPAGSTAYSYVRDVDYTSANGLLIKRQVWDEVGGLDEQYYPAYYEDVDLCMRLREHGYRVVYEPRAYLHHLESQSTSRSFRTFLLNRNRARFVAKWETMLTGFARREVRGWEVPDLAIEGGVQRARGSPPRLLVLAQDLIESGAGVAPEVSRGWWDGIEALSRAGWSVVVAIPNRGTDHAILAERTARTDRLAELGIDVWPEDVDQVVAATGSEFEAIVVGTAGRWSDAPITRPDGTSIPVVRSVLRAGDDAEGLVERAIGDVARRSPRPPTSGHAGPNGTGQPQADHALVEPFNRHKEASVSIPPPDHEHPAPDELVAQARWDLDQTRRELAIKNEYISALETEIISALETEMHEAWAQLRTKSEYIESLPSVRLKAWILGLLSSRKR